MAIVNYTLPKRHWRFPEAAKFGRVIPKEKLYSQAGVSPQLKQLFVEQVGQIKWAYKLAEATINLAKTEQVDEIEVIQIKLKADELSQQVLAAIDKAIPHPTLFVLVREQQGEGKAASELCYMAAHKQKAVAKANESTKNNTKKSTKEKWQQSQYLQSAWLKLEGPSNIAANQLPTATHLQGLYEQLLDALLPMNKLPQAMHNTIAESPAADYVAKKSDAQNGTQAGTQANSPDNTANSDYLEEPAHSKKSIDEKLADLAQIEALTKQIQQIKNKRDKEKQFNRRLELNNQFKALNKQLASLIK